MINDCAFVGDTILKYLPQKVEKTHITRSRGLWSKTLGLAVNILRAKGDVYHVNYLLQDCYIALKLGKKPIIGHAHGSDLRSGLQHPLWSKIVSHNLDECDRIIVSTPDILGIAKQERDDAVYLPNPVDTKLFHPRKQGEQGDKLKVLIASDSNWRVKGTDIVIKALGRMRNRVDVSAIGYGVDFIRTCSLAKSLGVDLHTLPKVTHEEVRTYYWNADLVIDRMRLGSLGMVSLEAIACGRPVVTYVSSEYSEYRDFPLKDCDTEERIVTAIDEASTKLWEREYNYLEKNHSVPDVLRRLGELYGIDFNSYSEEYPARVPAMGS
jgi:glycosyltransferase involved in cell wall biosynthesis